MVELMMENEILAEANRNHKKIIEAERIRLENEKDCLKAAKQEADRLIELKHNENGFHFFMSLINLNRKSKS